MTTLASLKIKLFTDGADKAQIVEMAKLGYVAGFTTNPSLLKKAGVKDYRSYARELVASVPDRHISFEVISDEIEEMIAEARVITTFGKNVYVKLPVINTHSEPLYDAIKMLSGEGVKINVTVVTTEEQAKRATAALAKGPGGLCRFLRAASRTLASTTVRSWKRRCARRARPSRSRSSGPPRAKCGT